MGTRRPHVSKWAFLQVQSLILWFRSTLPLILQLINPFSAGKIEKLDFERTIIPQTLNINNLRTTSAKSINLHTIRKAYLIFFKKHFKRVMFTSAVFEILLSEIRSVLSPAQRGVQGAKGLNFQWKTKKIFGICWNCLKSDWLTSLGFFKNFV